MVMPCSRSAARPSTSSAKSMFCALRADLLRVRLQRRELILEDHLRVVQQPADQRRFAVIDAAAGDEAQQALVLVLRRGRRRCPATSSAPDSGCRDELIRSTPPASSSPSGRLSWSITRPCRSEVVVSSISWMISGSVRPGSRRRRSADSSPGCGSGRAHLRHFSPGVSGMRSSSTMITCRRAPPPAAARRSTAARSESSPGGCTARRRARSSWRAETRGCSRPCACVAL